MHKCSNIAFVRIALKAQAIIILHEGQEKTGVQGRDYVSLQSFVFSVELFM
jgi:hypothetical protein